jgi:exopolysaccharide biosynthesis polyprenyl glycosylphosphotransferase
VSSVLIRPTHGQPQSVECARLIPGEDPAGRRSLKKPIRSSRWLVLGTTKTQTTVATGHPLRLLSKIVPHPPLSRSSPECLQSICIDFAVIAFNWLLLGGLLAPLHAACPAVPVFEPSVRSLVFLFGISLLHAALITLLCYVERVYRQGAEFCKQTKSISKAVLCGSLFLCLVYGLQGSHWSVVGLIYLAGTLHFAAMWLWRWWGSDREPIGGVTARNVLIIGSGPVGRRVADYLESHPNCGRKFCGFLDEETLPRDDVIGRVSDLALMARKGFVDEVILAAPHDGKLAGRVLREAKRLRLDLEIVPELFGCDSAEHEIENVGGLPVICVHAERLPTVGLVIKRMIDLVGASLGLILISPVLLTIALLIKLDSMGPVLYVARRAGRKGRLFRCYKFRTMVTDADQRKHSLRAQNLRSGPIFKVLDDPRITRVGGFLRRYSLDELPQLWNVVRGEMSLVGPRPHPADEFADYDVGHLARLDITPGLTGLWQVSARRDPSFDRAMELDREYIRSWSLELDFRILLKTILAVAQGSGS